MSGRAMPSPPLPIAPLLAFLPENDAAAAEAVGVHVQTIHRWRTHETATITRAAADRIACAIGLNPANVWFYDWW